MDKRIQGALRSIYIYGCIERQMFTIFQAKNIFSPGVVTQNFGIYGAFGTTFWLLCFLKSNFSYIWLLFRNFCDEKLLLRIKVVRVWWLAENYCLFFSKKENICNTHNNFTISFTKKTTVASNRSLIEHNGEE